MKTILSNQTVDIPENVDVALKGPGGTFWKDLTTSVHNSVSLERKRSGSELTNGGK